jgi:hypothetical protein
MKMLLFEERRALLASCWTRNRDLFTAIYRSVMEHEPQTDRNSEQLIGEVLAREYPHEYHSFSQSA